MSINSVSKSIALKIGKELDLSIDKQEIIEYGTINLLSQSLSIIVLFIVALILQILREAIVIAFCSALLRKYSGGAHCSSPFRCAMLSVVVVPLLSFLAQYIYSLPPSACLLILVLVGLVSIAIFYLYAPKDSPSKPIKNKNKIAKFKMKSVIVSTSIVIISIVLFYLNVGQVSALAILGLFNQAFTLTKPGYISIEIFDKMLKFII